MKILFIDTETTGLKPSTADAFQIGGILIETGAGEILREQRFFTEYCPKVLTEGELSEQNKACHGYTEAAINNLGSPKQAFEVLSNFLYYANGGKVSEETGNYPILIAGWNVSFDIGFLRKAIGQFARFKWQDYFHPYTFIDIKGAALAFESARVFDEPVESYSLGNFIDRYGLKVGKGYIQAYQDGPRFHAAHNAAYDAEMTFQVYKHLFFNQTQ
jgi:DNA polymerase III epsilon subunit-like protein